MTLLSLHHIEKTYKAGKLNVAALEDINLNIEQGEMVAIMGPSGSGKSTLMHIIGLLDRPSSGTVKLSSQPLDLSMPDRKLAQLRSERIGFVFQSFNLLPRLSALDNVMLPVRYYHNRDKATATKAKQLLTDLGLGNRYNHQPNELSGGERQRVAIARALINGPDIILADEPTGNLDSKSGQEVMQILKDLNAQGKTVIIITHDPDIAAQCRRVIRLKDGRIEGESRQAQLSHAQS